MISTVTTRGQTAIPAAIRRQFNIVPHTRLEWIDDGHSITVIPVPKDPITALHGKFKNRHLDQALSEYRATERARG